MAPEGVHHPDTIGICLTTIYVTAIDCDASFIGRHSGYVNYVRPVAIWFQVIRQLRGLSGGLSTAPVPLK